MTGPLVRVVVADRFPIVRRGVRLLIEDLGHFRVVGEAGDGREALRLAQEAQPNIVVTDFCLAELNALELMYQVRRAGLRTEFLIYTDGSRENVAPEALRAGAKGFVLKSESDHHIASALHALAARTPYFSSGIMQLLLDQFLQSAPGEENCGLTSREREIVQLIAEGQINKQISHTLDVSVKTVECHRASAMRKLELRTTADLVRYAVRNDMIQA